MKKLRVGVVGCGQIAQIMHLPFLSELPEFEIAAVCDISPKVVDTVGEWYHVSNRYLDYHDLIVQPDIDIVLVLTMDHAEVAEAAANTGKHLFIEKPLCFNLAEGDRILEAARCNHIKVMVGYMKRFDPGYEYGVRIMKGTQDIRLIRVHDFGGNFGVHGLLFTLVAADDIPQNVLAQGQAKIDASMKAALGPSHAHLTSVYSMLLGLCTHDLAVLRGAFGPPQAVLYSNAFSKNYIISVLDYGDKCQCIFEGGLSTDLLSWDERLTAFGRNRIVDIVFPNPYVKYASTLVTIQENEDGAPVFKQLPVSYQEAFRREWLHFYECIEEDREPLTNALDARDDVELAIEMIRAVRVK
jgi:predicted dehydrogenase